MIEGITRNIAALSVLGLMYAAAFNVGYFASFGLHFIGVMDVTNFVYSFAFLLVFFGAFASTILIGANKLVVGPNYWASGKRAGRSFIAAAIVTLPLYWYFRGYQEAVLIAVTSYVFAVCGGMAFIYGQWAQTKRLKMQWLAVLVVGSLIGLAIVGRAFGEQQKLSRHHYTFATKSGNINGAAMLRSSSIGFLISVNGMVQFIASSEVKSVTLEK